jgi:hypothetical protein
LILDPDFALVAEQNGKIVAFGLALPNYNEIFKTIKKGRLLPTGIFKLLFGKKNIKACVFMLWVLLMGIVKWVSKLFVWYHYKNIQRKGLKWAEAGWTLEHNT